MNTIHTLAVKGAGGVEELRRRYYRLTVGKGRTQTVRRCLEDWISIGSHEGNRLVVTHPTVSRFHARLELDSDGYALTDLDSTNGTFVGELRIKGAYLAAKSKLRFGEVEAAFEVEREDASLGIASSDRFGALWGASRSMRRLFDELARISASDATVLLQGETGSGKDLVASEIHRHGARRDRPFVVVDCASLPEALIESELFGHERGAFTGAASARAGAFEEADGGTLFLDEIGELPAGTQAKLLRALEARTVKRVGGNEWKPVDVRVIAATNKDLQRLCAQRLFREDLYFRLAVITVRIPALRERPEDLPVLINALLEEMGAAQALELDEPLLLALRSRRWAGNVRELRNVVQRALVLGPEAFGEVPSVADKPALMEEPFKVAKARAIEEFERRFLAELLVRFRGNVAQAARAGELDPAWIFRLVKRHQIDLAALRRGEPST